MKKHTFSIIVICASLMMGGCASKKLWQGSEDDNILTTVTKTTLTPVTASIDIVMTILTGGMWAFIDPDDSKGISEALDIAGRTSGDVMDVLNDNDFEVETPQESENIFQQDDESYSTSESEAENYEYAQSEVTSGDFAPSEKYEDLRANHCLRADRCSSGSSAQCFYNSCPFEVNAYYICSYHTDRGNGPSTGASYPIPANGRGGATHCNELGGSEAYIRYFWACKFPAGAFLPLSVAGETKRPSIGQKAECR